AGSPAQPSRALFALAALGPVRSSCLSGLRLAARRPAAPPKTSPLATDARPIHRKSLDLRAMWMLAWTPLLSAGVGGAGRIALMDAARCCVGVWVMEGVECLVRPDRELERVSRPCIGHGDHDAIVGFVPQEADIDAV